MQLLYENSTIHLEVLHSIARYIIVYQIHNHQESLRTTMATKYNNNGKGRQVTFDEHDFEMKIIIIYFYY